MQIKSILLITLFLFFLFIGKGWGDTTPLSIAQSQIGLGEMGGNNQGKYVRQYLNGRENFPWCAGFISYCIKKAELNIPYTLRAKDFLKLGKLINASSIKVGDLIIFSRREGGHIGIIEKVTREKITTIEGNLGEYPAKIRRVIYNRNNIKNLLGFVRLTHLKK